MQARIGKRCWMKQEVEKITRKTIKGDERRMGEIVVKFICLKQRFEFLSILTFDSSVAESNREVP